MKMDIRKTVLAAVIGTLAVMTGCDQLSNNTHTRSNDVVKPQPQPMKPLPTDEEHIQQHPEAKPMPAAPAKPMNDYRSNSTNSNRRYRTSDNCCGCRSSSCRRSCCSGCGLFGCCKGCCSRCSRGGCCN